jgi:hypothetical protein
MAMTTVTRFLLIVLCLLPALSGAQTEARRLITPEEEQRDNAAPQVPPPPDRPPPPTIALVQPDISQPIRNPATIEVQFTPAPGTAVDMNSFKATYGRLGIDITRRLLDHAVATPTGLLATDVELPSGNHRVTLSIADTAGRTASKTFHLSVAR